MNNELGFYKCLAISDLEKAIIKNETEIFYKDIYVQNLDNTNKIIDLAVFAHKNKLDFLSDRILHLGFLNIFGKNFSSMFFSFLEKIIKKNILDNNFIQVMNFFRYFDVSWNFIHLIFIYCDEKIIRKILSFQKLFEIGIDILFYIDFAKKEEIIFFLDSIDFEKNFSFIFSQNISENFFFFTIERLYVIKKIASLEKIIEKFFKEPRAKNIYYLCKFFLSRYGEEEEKFFSCIANTIKNKIWEKLIPIIDVFLFEIANKKNFFSNFLLVAKFREDFFEIENYIKNFI